MAATALPEALRARDRRPGTPAPTPGTVSARVRKVADGAALGFLIGLLIVLITMVQLRFLRTWRQ